MCSSKFTQDPADLGEGLGVGQQLMLQRGGAGLLGRTEDRMTIRVNGSPQFVLKPVKIVHSLPKQELLLSLTSVHQELF